MKERYIFAFQTLAPSCLPADVEYSITSEGCGSRDLQPHLEMSVSGCLFPLSLQKHFAL